MAQKIQFEDPVSFSNEPCRTINKTYLKGGDPFVMSICLTNSFLKDLNKYKEKYGWMSLIDIINTQLRHIKIQQSPRVEKRLKCQCSHVINQYRTKYKGGRKRYAFGDVIYTLALNESELYNFTGQGEEDLTQLDNDRVEREVRCEEIWCTIENVQIQEASPPDFDALNNRQRRRRLDKITEQSKTALEFLHKYGLTPRVLKLTSPGQQEHQVSFQPQGYSDLPEEGKDKLRSIVTILDRYGVSEAAYHELTQVFKDLPRTHSVVNARSDMRSPLNIQRVHKGAMVSFKQELKQKVEKALKDNPDLEHVTVHLSADGTRVSRISTFVIFSFQLVDLVKTHPSLDLCTLAIVNAKEDYGTLKNSLRKLFEEINSVVDEGEVTIGEMKISVQIVFCADMKMILTVMGLGSATSLYSCPWCFVRRDERHDTTYPLDYYNSDDMRRSTDKTKQHADQLSYGTHHVPLLNIQTENYVIDELHLLLRVTDMLLKFMIDTAKLQDEKETCSDRKHIQELVECIRACGVSFSVWNDKETKKLSWTSLSGIDKKKLLEKLPHQLQGTLNADSEAKIPKLWSLFHKIHQDATKSTSSSAENIFQMSKTWVETFLSLDPTLKDHITPYIHSMVYHIPTMIRKFGSLRPFSCQIVEKNNDEIKKIYQRKAYKWDPTMEVLRIRKRMEEHSSLTRVKRKYTKRNDKYWAEELKETRQRKRAKIQAENEKQSPSSLPGDLNTLSVSELRDVLQQQGVSSKIKSKDKLLQMIEQQAKGDK